MTNISLLKRLEKDSNLLDGKKLHKLKFYKKAVDKTAYANAQIVRHSIKISKKRNRIYYDNLAKDIKKIYSEYSYENYEKFKMLCLGTRNNFERDYLRELLKNKHIFSLDIATKSNADFITDFNRIEFTATQDNFEAAPCLWAVIFSNAIDHCIDPSSSYLNWLDNVSTYGHLIVDFYAHVGEVNRHDCSSFTEETTSVFLKKLSTLNFIKIKSIYFNDQGLLRTIVQKII